jgi:microcin C transport system substrate-binding protein
MEALIAVARKTLVFVFAAFVTFAVLPPAQAQSGATHHHALSLIRPPKYPADFTHFNYVNPDAPKGGAIKIRAIGTFDNLNPAIFRGNLALDMGLIYDQLMSSSLDEPSVEYCLLCEWVSYPDDFSSVTFKLRGEAKWHDGKPVTPEDVIFSMEIATGKDPRTGQYYNPRTAQYYKNVVKGEKTGPREVTFHFDTKNNRELPLITGQLLVLPKHYWTGKDAKGNNRNIASSTLEPPLSSGPYKIGDFQAGRSIRYERVPDYWGANLPVNRGTNNFDTIQVDYYRDLTVSFEAFKGGQFDFYNESSAKNWATAYDFPAVKDGRVIRRDDIRLKTPEPMQAFVLNTRRPKFQDARVRKALNLAFDFEWANKNLFFGQYARTSSFFENQELAAKGLPGPDELKLLEPFRGKIPDEVFTTEFKNPVNSTPEDVRDHLREASELLKQAGWDVKGGVLRNAKGEPFQIEFMIDNEAFVRVVLPYVQTLKRLGIAANVRQVDDIQAKRRQDDFDFDIIVGVFAQSESPGNEQRDFWSSAAANTPGSRNLAGISNPVVDALVDKVIFAPNRDALVAACRALDRVLLWNYYVVPQWYAPTERIAYWNKFGSPNPLPSRSVGFPTVWWYDAGLAAKLAAK